jgi:uncharacterized Zn-finger protein
VVFTEEDFPEPEVQVEEPPTKEDSTAGLAPSPCETDDTFPKHDLENHASSAGSPSGVEQSLTAVSTDEEKRYPCSFLRCTKRFFRAGDMRRHVARIHVAKPSRERQERIPYGYPCSQCQKRHHTAGDLRKHVARAHLPESSRQQQCAHCTARFLWPKDLRRHMTQIHGKMESTRVPPTEDLDQDAPLH